MASLGWRRFGAGRVILTATGWSLKVQSFVASSPTHEPSQNTVRQPFFEQQHSSPLPSSSSSRDPLALPTTSHELSGEPSEQKTAAHLH